MDEDVKGVPPPDPPPEPSPPDAPNTDAIRAWYASGRNGGGVLELPCPNGRSGGCPPPPLWFPPEADSPAMGNALGLIGPPSMLVQYGSPENARLPK